MLVVPTHSDDVAIESFNGICLNVFAEQQINSLLVLLGALKKNYAIPAANFIGHADIAPTRKNDPNVTFPWQQLADKGFGLWYGDTSKVILPQSFSSLQALRIIG